MAKKKKVMSFFSKNGVYLLMVIALLIIPFCFLEGLKDTDYNLFNFAFGKTVADGGQIGSGKINFSFLLTLAIFLPLVGSIVIGFVVPNKFLKGLLIAVCFVASAVLFFITPQITSMTATIAGFSKTTSFSDYDLSAAPIVCGIISILGALVGAGYSITK